MKKSTSGFTVIELIIIIVIIAILAAITLVAYRGVTARANDAQTIAAAEQWMKALMTYRARNGSLPNVTGCLGANYKYNVDGAGTSGIGQCRQDSATYGVTDDPALDAMLAPYISSQPAPSMLTTATNSATNWYRGIYYYLYPDPGGSGQTFARIDFVLTSSTSCPTTLGGVTGYAAGQTTDKDWVCHYSFGNSASYN